MASDFGSIMTDQQSICYEDIYTAEYSSKKDLGLFSKLIVNHNIDSVLEVGCGTGRIYESITNLKSDIDYVGIDYSKGALKYFKSHYPEVNAIDGVFPECLDPTLAGSFASLIFAFNGLSYVPESKRAKFFEGCKAALNSSGRMLLHFYRFDPARLNLADEPEEFSREFEVKGVSVKKFISTQRIGKIASGATRRTFTYRFANNGKASEISKDFDVYPCKPDTIYAQIKTAGFIEIQKFSDPLTMSYDPLADDLYISAS